jgi:SAM-dependent MidA family methyltransferase
MCGANRRTHSTATGQVERSSGKWQSREMAEAFSQWRYIGVDVDSGEMPERFAGVVFSNEFFDALPVDAAVYRDGAFREQRVSFDGR